MPAALEEDKQTDSGELEQKPTGQQQEEQHEEAKPTDNDEMRTAIADLAKTVKGIAEPKEKEKELTPEEIEELWGVFKPKQTRPDFMKKFFRLNPDATPEEEKEAEELFETMKTGVVRQAIVGARNYITIAERKLREDFKEALDFVSEIKAERLQKQFQEKYPALADPKYAKIVGVQAKLLKDKTWPSQDDYFKELAEGSAEAIKAIVPDFDLGKTPEKKPAATTPRLPRTTQGGGGGAGKGSGEPVKTAKSDSDSLL